MGRIQSGLTKRPNAAGAGAAATDNIWEFEDGSEASEEIEVAGDELVARIKHLAAEGQVRRVRLIEPDGDIILDMPLTIGAIAGGAVVLAAPLLAVVGALAACVGKVKLEIVRNGNGPPAPPEPH